MASAAASQQGNYMALDRKLNSELKEKFQKLHETLAKENLLPVIDHLFAEGVISEAVEYKLRRMPTEREQSRELLSVLRTSQHPLAFVKVNEAMMAEEAYKPILEQLDELKVDIAEPISGTGLKAVSEHSLLPELNDYIRGIFPKMGDDEVHQLTAHLRSLGVDDIEDMRRLKECHLTGHVKPIRMEKLLEAIVAEQMKPSIPRVVHTLPGTESVIGVTSLDDELYVLREKDKEQVEVYNTTTTREEEFRLLRTLSVPGVNGLIDMTSCKHYRCLYIADWSSNRCIHRVELNGKITKWSVNTKPHRLSVTSQFTVLVTCWNESKLFELTTKGKQLREITLQPDIVNPRHAIQLSNGHFVVGHGFSKDPVHRVCIVDTNGHVTHSYGGPSGSATVGQLNETCHLAVDKDEFIFVADYYNSRVLLLSPTLNCVREIVSRDQLKGEPRRLFLDADRRRLYVAVGGRVVVVQL